MSLEKLALNMKPSSQSTRVEASNYDDALEDSDAAAQNHLHG